MKKLICLPLLLIACSPSATSKLKEAPDLKNRVDQFELTSMPTYDAIKGIKSVRTSIIPWSDTYWPLMDKGLSRRWGRFSNDSLIGFSNFWKEEQTQGAKQRVSPYLSPAEKYDIAFRQKHALEVDEKLLKQELDAFQDIEKDLSNNMSLADGRTLMGSLHKSLSDARTLKRWSPMAIEGWKAYLSYSSNEQYQFLDRKDTGEDWSWMGHCHGWAPAATMALAPKHSVMAVVGDKEIFFSEGDIRGLLTKSWADHSPAKAEYFLGRRCNENLAQPEGEIPHDNSGRGVSGQLVQDGKTKRFTMVDEYLPAGAVTGRRVYQIRFEGEEDSHYLLEKNTKAYALVDNKDQTRPFVETGKAEGAKELSGVKFFGCWDINPASFHTLLTQYLPKEDIGFVMDRTRTGQVWNQPIYGADFKLGELKRADSVDDIAFMHRAEDTTYLMVVTARVFWSTEPDAPKFDYANDFDQKHIASLDYTYTLEFDANKTLIGGEWGDLKGINPAQVTPDFLFGYKKGSLPVDNVEEGFDYSSIIGPIHDCSLKSENMKTSEINGQSISYAVCDLNK